MSFRTSKIYNGPGGSGSGGGGGSVNIDEFTNTNFTGTVINLPNPPTKIIGVFLNGQRLTVSIDYTQVGSTITLLNAAANDIITVIYSY